METHVPIDLFTYQPPGEGEAPRGCLVVERSPNGAHRFPFQERLEVGRFAPQRTLEPGLLLIQDPTVSWRHCVISRRPAGHFVVRDVSRNGTRVDGRRLVPNVEVALLPGQTIAVGSHAVFRLEQESRGAAASIGAPEGGTVGLPGNTFATVLVGDIRDYTVMVRKAPPDRLQRCVGRVFGALTEEVARRGGTVKEYQGDAIFAFWEGAAIGGDQAISACDAALALSEKARRLAADTAVWDVPGFELEMDFALATGSVVIDSFGGDSPTGLSMIGEPVVLAFRLEKFADDAIGSILACPDTKACAAGRFEFRDLGLKQAKGFDAPDHVFALVGEVPGSATVLDGSPRRTP